ncbi:hypothetical protein BRC68_08850 [Halobacteriales archaeon QH_6_64_20]|nr:MAG: hypothetical protein BRC68_08850 [Halobacteriales archaeon QH_6_64_20]
MGLHAGDEVSFERVDEGFSSKDRRRRPVRTVARGRRDERDDRNADRSVAWSVARTMSPRAAASQVQRSRPV